MATYRMRSVRLDGGVKMATFQNNSTATDVAGVVSDLNSLLGKLRTSGALETPNS